MMSPKCAAPWGVCSKLMRKLDVKEIHGYNAGLGLKLIKPEKLGAKRKKSTSVAGKSLANGKKNGAVARGARAKKKS